MNQTCVKPGPTHLRTSDQSTALGDQQVLKSGEVGAASLWRFSATSFPHRYGRDVTHSSAIFSTRSLGAASFVSTAWLTAFVDCAGHSFSSSSRICSKRPAVASSSMGDMRFTIGAVWRMLST